MGFQERTETGCGCMEAFRKMKGAGTFVWPACIMQSCGNGSEFGDAEFI